MTQSSKPLSVGHYIPAYNEQVNVSIVSQALNDGISLAQEGISYRFWSGHSCDLIAMRNQALDKALRLGLDFLFMQDSDVYSPAQGGPLMPLLRTAQETEATMTGALVSLRTEPPRANVYPVMPGEVYECHKLGTGMVLINLNKVREWYEDYDGPCFQRTYETDKCITPKVGSDIFFCYVIQQHNQTVVCDATIPTVHINGVHRLPYDGHGVPNAEGQTAAMANGSLNPLMSIGGR